MLPVVLSGADGVLFIDKAREPGPDEHPQPVGGEGKKLLRRILDLGTRLFLGVHITGDEEEIVADPMEDDPSIEHPLVGAKPAVSKANWKSTRLNSSHIPLSRMPSSA